MITKGCAGLSTILVNVGGGIPLVLTGNIERDYHRYSNSSSDSSNSSNSNSDDTSSVGFTEVEEFLVVDVVAAILPPGFPLTIAALTRDVAINVDYVIAVIPS
ncbi:hypothetical protein [Pelosinus sp. IPA-1]|uniref:hypothetical protein n=1 Tax=Pelosinus sp. IPA-1 TaxID=3029569 RepID=UPI0024361E95|nr:hypothetical protein [Pelosinus sp. IPA-1]GMA98633.1 hypothetical protein PIPA1_14330 [Pelosinus sp. IPA-1]